jgi:hypothetical protein
MMLRWSVAFTMDEFHVTVTDTEVYRLVEGAKAEVYNYSRAIVLV